MVKTVSPIFRNLFQNVKDPVLILNTSCQIELINDTAAQLLNIDTSINQELQLDEPSKSNWLSFLTKILSDFEGYCNLNIKIGENVYQQIRLKGYFVEKKNLIFARIVPIKGKGYILQERSSMDVYTIFNDIPHGIILTDMNGMIVKVNDLALYYVQCEKGNIINKLHDTIFENLIDIEYSKLQYKANLLNNGRASINVSNINDMGEQIYLKLDSKINYKMNLVVTTITDETEKVLLKQKVDHQNSLNSVGHFAASIAHEIRNPMTSLKGFVELLKMNNSTDNKNYLNVMESELQRMDLILSELLFLSKPRELHYNEISIEKVVKEVIELLMPQAFQHHILLKLETSDYYNINIIGSDNRLKQMLINLVKNAIEVMENGGTITMKIENNNHVVNLSIIDQGPGLRDSEVQHLFTPFYTTKSTGTGLGLPLVKKVIDEHNGSIVVKSTVGEGTTFKISLPISDSQHMNSEPEHIMDMWFQGDTMNRLSVI